MSTTKIWIIQQFYTDPDDSNEETSKTWWRWKSLPEAECTVTSRISENMKPRTLAQCLKIMKKIARANDRDWQFRYRNVETNDILPADLT